MRPDLAPRLLALPRPILDALARVEGPGWYVSRRDGATALHDCAPYVRPEPLAQRGPGFTEAWFPANPAAAVAAVLGVKLYRAYSMFVSEVPSDCGEGGDHAAALSIIEAHVANRSPA